MYSVQNVLIEASIALGWTSDFNLQTSVYGLDSDLNYILDSQRKHPSERHIGGLIHQTAPPMVSIVGHSVESNGFKCMRSNVWDPMDLNVWNLMYEAHCMNN